MKWRLSEVDHLEDVLPAGHRRMSGVPGTTLVRRRNTAAPAPAAEAAAKTEATAPLPDVERAALAALQRDLFEAHGLCFTVSGVGVVGGGRFQVSLTCPDSEWLDLRRNVFELGGKLPPALRKGLEATIRGAARAWKLAPAPSGQPGLALISTLAQIALRAGAAPKGKDLDTLGIAQVPGDPTARACLAAIVDLILSGEAQTPAGGKQVEELAQAVAVLHAQTAKTLLAAMQLAARDDVENAFDKLRKRDCLKTVLEIDPVTKQKIMECRQLTAGEIALAVSVFGTSIPYESVRVHRRKYWPPQGENMFMAPDGDIYADKDGNVYSDDYSTANFSLQATFIHEMVHVWQVRVKGINLEFRAPFERQYAYTIDPGKRFSDYKLEQQGAIVGDYFRYLHGQEPIHGRPLIRGEVVGGNTALAVYRRLLPFVPD